MAIYKRGRLWWVRFTAPGGQRVRESTGTDDRQKAQQYHDQLKAELWRIHKLGEKPRRTWQEAVVRWLQEKDHKANSYKDVQQLRWMDQYLGGLYLDEITREIVEKVGEGKRAEASVSTANRYLALLRAILRAARDDWEWIDRAPRVRLLPEARKRVRYLTRDQAARLLAELPPHLADLAAFTLATGLRQSNASGLRWDQIDRSRGVAWIHPDQSKSRKAIAVPLNADAMAVLERCSSGHDVYVFTYQGAPVLRTSTKAWYAALKRAGIRDFRVA